MRDVVLEIAEQIEFEHEKSASRSQLLTNGAHRRHRSGQIVHDVMTGDQIDHALWDFIRRLLFIPDDQQ